MKFYWDIFKLIIDIVVLKKSNGEAIKKFCQNNGLAYIKLAQILATQNYGTLFTEQDRKDLETICDNVNPIPFSEIRDILENEYGDLNNYFISIEKTPLGSASISQVHKAILKDGTVVALKIKRKDIAATLEDDLKKLKEILTSYIEFLRKKPYVQKIINKYIPLLNLGNKTGFEQAFKLYYSWILEETDFTHEAKNIRDHANFANQVNDKVPNTIHIVIPQIYDSMCSENIIVMEYIPHPNFNHIEDNEAKAKALNDYISLCFYAMFNNLDVYFHGDPHGGNIYLDNEGNIGFLDMGLLFKLSYEELQLTKSFFLSAYSRNSQKLFEILMPYAELNFQEKQEFKREIEIYCSLIQEKSVTAYFTDMINIIKKYNIKPPTFLFCMAKAFVCLNGINVLSNNTTTAFELLKKQTLEYLISESISDLKCMGIKFLELSPSIIHGGMHFALHKTVPEEDYNRIKEALKKEEVSKALNDALDILQLIKNMTNDSLRR